MYNCKYCMRNASWCWLWWFTFQRISWEIQSPTLCRSSLQRAPSCLPFLPMRIASLHHLFHFSITFVVSIGLCWTSHPAHLIRFYSSILCSTQLWNDPGGIILFSTFKTFHNRNIRDLMQIVNTDNRQWSPNLLRGAKVLSRLRQSVVRPFL